MEEPILARRYRYFSSAGVLSARSRGAFVARCGELGRHLPQLLPFAAGTVQPETRQTSRTEPVQRRRPLADVKRVAFKVLDTQPTTV